MLQDAKTKFGGAGGLPDTRGAEWIHHAIGNSRARLSAGTAPSEALIQVYANHGRWIVECPDCHNAQLACRTDPRFMCNECGNVAIGELWRPVEWPANPQGIEAVLGNRPLANQNWHPGEALQDLAAENIQHGRGV